MPKVRQFLQESERSAKESGASLAKTEESNCESYSPEAKSFATKTKKWRNIGKIQKKTEKNFEK